MISAHSGIAIYHLAQEVYILLLIDLYIYISGGSGGGGASSGQVYQGYGKAGYGLIKCDIEYSDFCIYFAPLQGGNGGIAERPWYWIKGGSGGGGGGRHGNTDEKDGIAGQFGEINHTLFLRKLL